ncbi:MAG: hypothetical protein IJ899_12745 [Blautia sp.]|nr:hypothetical protein [Blautia sp.]
MFKFVQQYATQEVIVLLIAFMGWLWKRLQEERKEDRILRDGILALLHDRLYQECILLIRRGWASVDDKNNVEHLARPYFDLGGNGTGKEIYTECMELPMEEPQNPV